MTILQFNFAWSSDEGQEKGQELTGGCHAGKQEDHADSKDADEERKVADQHEAALHQNEGKQCAHTCSINTVSEVSFKSNSAVNPESP